MSPAILRSSPQPALAASLSHELSAHASASDVQALASDEQEGAGGPVRPVSTKLERVPGMHIGHDLLVAGAVAVALYATLLLNAIHLE
jgi:hypothetical protein